MIYDRSEFDEYVLHNGKWYECDYAYVKLDKDGAQGGDGGLVWHKLKGVDVLSFSSRPQPRFEEEDGDYDPLDYARQ